MNKLFGVFVLGMSVFVFSAHAAYDYKAQIRPYERNVFESDIGDKLTRGLTNAIFGWSEAFITPTQWARGPKRGVASAVMLGVPYGLLRAVGRTAVGVYEVGTFFSPQDPIFYPLEGDVK